jgi:hypothetical protein
MIAAIRPDDWNLVLFLHLLGAMVMFAALVTAAYYLFAARRDGSVELTRNGFRCLLYAALPSYLVMRIAAQSIASKEGLEDSDAAWIGIGYLTSDLGALAIVVATVVTGLAVRRARGTVPGSPMSPRDPALAAWLTGILVVVYVIAIWAMATKPG